jgi:concentrative nucleoside transporter, CNT family
MGERLVSLLGIAVITGIAWASCPRDRRGKHNWRTVGGALALLFGFALLVLKTPARVVFSWATDVVDRFLEFSLEGARFLFGPLADRASSMGMIFAFQILPTIIFFAAVMSLLYHIGVMPLVVRGMGRAMARLLGISGPESFSTVADIFVGQTEAPLVVRPYVSQMTLSELMACMTAGFATTAGGVLAAYVGMLKDYVPGIAGHLIACSVMAAPASIAIAKLMLPEIEKPVNADAKLAPERAADNVLDAIAGGTFDGLRLAVNVGAMLIAFIALTAVVNWLLGLAGASFGLDLSLERILGWLFSPLAWVMGVPSEDVTKVGSLLGQKTVLNEFLAYSRMSQELAHDPTWLSERGRLIASYALCGFANFSSIGIQIGGYSGLAPERRGDLARLGLRAMFGGLLTTCLVASVAGLLA